MSIPKTIHYIWFGENQKSETILKCIESWKNVLKDYEIKQCGNESIEQFSRSKYFSNAIKEKKWAFASDYARLKVLYEEGGIYLDTDMFVLKTFDDFLDFYLVLGKEDEVHISAGMIAAQANNEFIRQCLEEYENLKEGGYITIPRVLTKVYVKQQNFLPPNSLPNKSCPTNLSIENFAVKNNIKIFESKYFYPFTAENIKDFNFKNAPTESYAVHLWDYSWGRWYIKFFKKIGLHKKMVKIAEKMGVKKVLKKIFKVI
jgi:mannosyltransferase OCH1-like enzyme